MSDKTENNWYQKRLINNSGEAKYTYYFQTESSEPAIAIEINTNLTRQYLGYTMVKKDLQDTLNFIDILLTQIDIPDKSADIMVKALSRSIAITYGKCFSEAHET